MVGAPHLLRARAAALALLLGGCAGDPSFPSLAPRPIEDLSLAEPTLPPFPAGTPGGEAMADYLPLVAKARDADERFRDALAAERGAIDRGRAAERGSDAWLRAQEGLSRVEAARVPVAAALADLTAARNGEAARADSGKARAAAEAYAAVQAIDTREADALRAATPAE